MSCLGWVSDRSSGLQSAGISRVLPVLGLVLALSVACTSAPQRVPVPAAEPTADTTGTEVAVVTPSPTVTSTPIPTLADDETASVTNVSAGALVTDAAGNQIAVHAVRELPPDLLVRPEDQVRIGQASAIDISMCRAGAFATADAVSVEFAVVAAGDTPLTSIAPLPGAIPLVAPGFALPDPGGCARGWLAVHVDSQAADIGRYVMAVATDEGTERHVYQWSGLAVDAEIDPGGQLFERGEIVTFNDGPLIGTTIELQGWAELIGAASPADTRQVGVRVEVCTATEDWPEFGLAVDGWNLVDVADPGDRLGADPLAPLSGNCFDGWLEFAVPFGQRPTGFSASDGIDRLDGFAAWTLAGAAIDTPPVDGNG